MPTYFDMEAAFCFVSGASYGENRAVYDKQTGKFLYQSDYTDENEIPDDFDPDRYIEIPHKNDLDLGRDLVFRFVDQALPDEADLVYGFFRHPGAYANFKNLLEQRDLLKQWHDFENAATREAIEEWCEENGIEITEKRPNAKE